MDKKAMYSIQKATTEFLQHCRYEKNLSPKTIKSYSIDLKQLSNFLTEKNYSLEITDITKNELREFLELISSLKPKSIKRKIATIKAMFNFLEFDDRIEINPFRKMRIKIKEPKTLPKVMDIKEIKKIFNTAYEKHSLSVNESEYKFFESLRDIVVIELLFATGARVSEIANLKVNSIDVQNGMVTIRGKGNKERIIQICNPETLHLLKNYHKRYLKEIEKSGGFFLINRLGKMLSDQSIRVIVKKLACRAKLKKHITPHVFRHSFATLLLEKDVDIKYIQSLLGHSSIMTTQIYTHVNRAQQKKILKTKHPRKDFSMLALLVS